MIQLTTDEDAEVREWATFGLAVFGERDFFEIQEALAARLNDACDEAREEALVGPAKRQVQRVLLPLVRSLESASAADRAIEAAAENARFGREYGGWEPADYADRLRKKFGP